MSVIETNTKRLMNDDEIQNILNDFKVQIDKFHCEKQALIQLNLCFIKISDENSIVEIKERLTQIFDTFSPRNQYSKFYSQQFNSALLDMVHKVNDL